MHFPRSRRLHSVMRFALAVGLMALVLDGCKSKQDEAVEQAKKQAAATGQVQQVVSTDKDGNTVTTTVQPPAPGSTDEAVTTTVTPKPPAAATQPAPSPTDAMTPAAQPAPAPPPPPPPIKLPAGTSLSIRIDQAISAKENNPGDRFTGKVVSDVHDADGTVAVPKGTPVKGTLDAAQERGKFKGAADIQLRLTSLTLNGRVYPIATHHVQETQKGKGKRTAGFIGGGAGGGALIGGIAGGGKGALIGGLIGAGAGTAGAALTGNKDLVIPAETVMNFKLKEELTLEPEGSEPD